MTENVKKGVTIPTWLLPILVTLIITAASFTIATTGRITRVEEKTQTNEKNIDRIYNSLERIENKIDGIKK